MRHETHVGLVDAHAKGNRCHHHHAVFTQERFEIGSAILMTHAAVVCKRTNAVIAQRIGHILGRCAVHAVDNARVAGVLFLDEVDKLAKRLGGLALFGHAVTDVGAIETRDEFLGVDQKLFDDFAARIKVGRGRERHARHFGP